MADDSLLIKIGADTRKFKESLKDVRENTKDLDDSLRSMAKASGVAFAAMSGAVGVSVARFAKFQDQVTGVKTLLSDDSFKGKTLSDGFKQMSDEVLKLGVTSGQSLETLNKALFDTVSAGVPADQAIQTLGVSAKLATAGLTDVSIATDGMTSALNAYALGADQAENVASKFFVAQKAGKTTIAELASGFGLVGANAQAAGVDLNELLGAVSAVTTAGVRTNAAYTGMKAALANIAVPTSAAAAEAKRLGIEFNASALRAKGLEGFLNDLTQAQGFNKDSITRLFGSTEAQGIMFALTGKQAKNFKDNLVALKDETGAAKTFNDAYKESNETMAQAMRRVTVSLDVLAVKFGEQFAPAISLAADALQRFLKFASDNPALIKFAAAATAIGIALTGIITIGGFLASSLISISTLFTAVAAAGGLAALAMKGVAIAGALLFSPFTAVIAVVTAAVAAIIYFKDEITSLMRRFGLLSAEVEKADVASKMEEAIAPNPENVEKKLDETKGVVAEKSAELLKLEEDFKKAKQALDVSDKDLAERLETEHQIKKAEIQAEMRELELSAEQEHDLKLLEMEKESRLLAFEAALTDDQIRQQQALTHQQAMLKIATDARKAELDRENKFIQDRAKAEFEDRERRIAEERKARELFLQEEAKFGTTVAQMRQYFRSSDYENTKTFLGDLSSLTRTKNRELFELGKNAALANAVVSTAQAITNALAVQPYPLGLALAAGAAARGYVQIETIKGQKMAKGGMVTGGVPGMDSVPITAQKGEFIVPQGNFEEVVNAVAMQRAQQGAGAGAADQTGGGEVVVRLDISERAIPFIEAQLVERKRLGFAVG